MNESGRVLKAAQRSGAAPDAGDNFDLARLVRVVLRRKWYILCWLIVAVGIAVIYAFLMAVPTYTAKASLVMLNRSENIAGLDSVLSEFGGDQTEIMTEREILQSRHLVGQVVDALELISDPEFNPQLRPVPVISVAALRAAIEEEEAEPLTDAAVRSVVINNLTEAVQIRNVTGTYVFSIIATTKNAEKSATIANTLAEFYIVGQVQRKLAATELATEWLTGRADELRVQLEAAENRLASFISSTELISSEDLTLQNVQLKEFRARLENMQADERDLARLAGAYERAVAENDLDAIVALSGDAVLERTLQRAANGDLASRSAFDARVAELRRRLEIELARVRTQSQAVSQSVASLDEEVAALSRDLLTQQQLEREAEAAGLIYEHFLARFQETAVQQGLQQADSETLSRAEVPLEPSAPRKARILAMALLAGLAIGCALVMLRESQSRGLRSADDAEDAIGIPVIGQLPRGRSDRRQRLMKYVVDNPTSGMVEAVRNLRTSIQLSFMDAQPQVLMTTSALPDEGKSSSTMLLAYVFAQSGQRVLMIECDLRRRALREFLPRRMRKREKGLFAVSAGEATFEEAVTPYEDFGFDTLLCERVSLNASEYFLSKNFTKLIETARQEYNVVLLDVPPVLMVTDARIIGKHADAILFAFKWDTTDRDAVLTGVDLLRRYNLDITGLVMTQVDSKKLRTYGATGGYGGYYASSHKYYRG